MEHSWPGDTAMAAVANKNNGYAKYIHTRLLLFFSSTNQGGAVAAAALVATCWILVNVTYSTYCI